jgi:hypothetical protein
VSTVANVPQISTPEEMEACLARIEATLTSIRSKLIAGIALERGESGDRSADAGR